MTPCFLPLPSYAYSLVAGELESLMYTLIFWACEGHLEWDKCPEPGCDKVCHARSVKQNVMTFTFEVRLH